MDFLEFDALFCKACEKNGIELLLETQRDLFYRFTAHLMAVNQVTNLTAIRNIPDVIDKHYVDSLFASSLIPKNARVLDLGCGPGFPSIPLAIARPDLSIVALDSTAKKIAFVNESVKLLELSNLTAYAGRAEDAAVMKQLSKFDVVVSRAVANMRVLTELCLPYVKVEGVLLAMKAAKAEEELLEAGNAIRVLGGAKTALCSKDLKTANGTTETRCLITIQKEKNTPTGYPRAYATILKKPL